MPNLLFLAFIVAEIFTFVQTKCTLMLYIPFFIVALRRQQQLDALLQGAAAACTSVVPARQSQ